MDSRRGDQCMFSNTIFPYDTSSSYLHLWHHKMYVSDIYCMVLLEQAAAGKNCFLRLALC
jgi:hypothetical protein